jgi:hypothetical protein
MGEKKQTRVQNNRHDNLRQGTHKALLENLLEMTVGENTGRVVQQYAAALVRSTRIFHEQFTAAKIVHPLIKDPKPKTLDLRPTSDTLPS